MFSMGAFMTVQEQRGKIRDMYTFISERLYFNRPDLSVQGSRRMPPCC